MSLIPHLRSAAASLVLLVAANAGAVEVRRIPGRVMYEADLPRAFAECTAPNDVSRDGFPACSPPVTSSCEVDTAHVRLTSFSEDAGVDFHMTRPPTMSEPCRRGTFRLEVRLRPSSDYGDVACASGRCTEPDIVRKITFAFGFPTYEEFTIDGLGVDEYTHPYANFQVMGVRLFGPDGLPLAAAGVSQATGYSPARFDNLSLGYAECTAPTGGYDACDLEASTSPCDFASGTVQWGLGPTATTALTIGFHGLSGVSPLCTDGTYQVETRARVTQDACGPSGTTPCTLADTTITMPVSLQGSEAVGTTGFPSAGLSGTVRHAEILGTRVFDPTGTLFAASATMNGGGMDAPRLSLKAGKLRLRALLPASFFTDLVDLTEDPGFTLSIHDKNGPIYDVTVPASLWQLQAPVGERWSYRDRGGIFAGLRKASVKLKRKRGVAIAYDVRLDAVAVEATAADLPTLALRIRSARPAGVDYLGSDAESQAALVCSTKAGKVGCR